MKLFHVLFSLIILTTLLAACGQTGHLYLPQSTAQKSVSPTGTKS